MNWLLNLLIIALIFLFAGLGKWQLNRAVEKEQLLRTFEHRKQQVLTTSQLKQQDLRYYQVTLTGSFDNRHNLILDNKTFQGKIGYEVYTPFQPDGLNQAILIDRGFIPIMQSRKEVMAIPSIEGKVTINGLINTPPNYVSLGEIKAQKNTYWPLTIEYIDLDALSEILKRSLFPYVVTLPPNDPLGFGIEWQPTPMLPSKHKGYALQWFALSITLLIISLALLIKKFVIAQPRT